MINDITQATPIDQPTTRRVMASIRTIASIQPIYTGEGPEATNIALAVIEGWKVVVQKTEFKEGDLCVFFEIDSILPETEWSEFLRQRKFKIKTMKLNRMMVDFKPVISQGLALPLAILGSGGAMVAEEGDDVTEALGVTKYEPPEAWTKTGAPSAPFHSSVPKTDELRIQSFIAALGQLHGLPYYITQKLDGTSCTVVTDDGGTHVYSRNFEVDTESNYAVTAAECGVIAASQGTPGYAIQGEIVGPGIQGNKLGLPEPRMFVFNIYNIAECRYLNYVEMLHFCIVNNLQTVPVHETGSFFAHTLESLDLLSKGTYSASGKQQEGIVIRPKYEQYSSILGGRLSFKFINTSFLLENKE